MNARRTKETHVDVKDAVDPLFLYANTVRNGQKHETDLQNKFKSC